MSMYEMCVEGQSGLDETEKDYQIVQFRQMLDRVLSHVNDEHCRNNYRLIRLKGKFTYFLFSFVLEHDQPPRQYRRLNNK